MIQTEQINETLIRHYSDEGFKIKQIETEAVYDEAIDIVPCRYTYEETDELIPEATDEQMNYEELSERYQQLLDIITGGEEE